jgi:PAS domain S-box-containing protein
MNPDRLNQVLLAHIPEVVFITDDGGRFVFIDPNPESLFGKTRAEIEKMGTVFDLLGPRLTDLSKLGSPPQKETLEISFEPQSGGTRHLEVEVRRISLDGGTALLLCRDVGDRKKMEEENEKLTRQLVQAEKISSMGTFVSGIAHELNNPLTGILGFAEDLLESDLTDPKEVRNSLQVIYQEGLRSAKIVKNLLRFSSRYKPKNETIYVNEAVQSTLSLLIYQLTAVRIKIETDYAPNLPPVSGNYRQLQQVFLNVFSNAEYAMKSTGQGGTIRVRTRGEKDRVTVEIENDGPPIPESLLSRIFDPFFTTKEVGEGPGLGLSVCHGIIQEHEGTLTVENVSNRQGVRVTIRLPHAGGDPSQPGDSTDGEGEVDGTGKVALLVDPDETTTVLLRKILENQGFEVESATGADRAVKILKTLTVDLIISGVRNPESDGPRWFETVTGIQPKLGKSFILVTDKTGTEVEEFLRNTGAFRIPKPFSRIQVLNTLRSAL